ncbi:sodium channel protein Nach-like [Thrips palmi]|uniref:Sodium channel protein Nach-like n=1 Tax=Thrips palmi TaxID=161013 RepID=A0A6P8ZUT2_THRPL|nr:sodium channel protein Nach-like [Thrips palmi]
MKSLRALREPQPGLEDTPKHDNQTGRTGSRAGKEGKEEIPQLLVGIIETLANYHFPRFRLMKNGLSLIGDQLRYLDGIDIAQIMMKTRLSCKDLLVRCYWKGIAFKCCEQFQLQRTEMGYCMSFNSRTSTGPKILCSEKNCHHVWSTGPGTGLVMVFNDLTKVMEQRPLTRAYTRRMKHRVLAGRLWRKSTLDNNARSVWDSEEVFMDIRSWLERDYIQVMVHDRTKFPAVEQAVAFSTEVKTDFSMAVAYSITEAADDLKQLPFKDRNCLFSNEAKLETALQYSQPECITECRMQHVVDRCGCRPYYMEIYGERSASVPQCRFSQLPCLSSLNMIAINCSHCITTCRVSRFTFTVNPSISAHISDANIGTSIDISYDSNRAAVLYRHQLAHSFIDIWVTIGSLASLFLGCSILSILDILHLVLRVVRVALRSDFKPVFNTIDH